MVSEKGKTIKRHTSSESYRKGYEAVFGNKNKYSEYKHRPGLIDGDIRLYNKESDIKKDLGFEAEYTALPNGFFKVDLGSDENKAIMQEYKDEGSNHV